MRILNIFTVALFASIFITSCSNEEVSPKVHEASNDTDFELLEGNILRFKDQATFDRYVNDEVEIDGHYSLLDYYVEAINEAESYYDREGGYEEFKSKYSLLYFPEYENDYSAFLPVSSRNTAALLDLNGEVFIGSEKQNMIDINSPQQLIELGLLKEENRVSTRARANGFAGNPLNGLDDIHYNDRKMWVNVNSKPCPDPTCVQYIEIEVCFRKKGFLGAWYNYSSVTVVGTVLNSRGDSKSGLSSHDYRIPRAWGVPVPPFTQTFWVQFQGFGGVAGDMKFYFDVQK